MLVAMPFDDEDEAVRLANATQYGLAAYVWTNDLQRAHRVAHAIDTGMCWINSQNVRDLRTPFGGVKQSGIGREGGDYAFDFYCETEIVHVALGTHHIPRLRTRRAGVAARGCDCRDARHGSDRRSGRGARPSTSCARRTGELCVPDLEASSASTSTCSGWSSAPAPTTRCTCGAGRSAPHHSLVLRERADRGCRPPRRSASAHEADLELIARRLRRARAARRAGSDGRPPRHGTRAARLGPVRLPARVLPRDRAVRDAAAALRPPARRAGHAARPLQPALPARRGRRSRFWQELGFRCTEYISTDGADERLTGAWLRAEADGARRRADGGARAAPAPPRLRRLRAARRPARLRSAGCGRPGRRDRARAGASRRLERVLRLPARSGRPPHRALRLRLLHRRS